MLSPKDIGSKANASSIWSSDSGYETSRAISPSLQAQAPHDSHSYHTPNRTPVIFSGHDIWNAPSDCVRIREDPLVDPITTQLNVFTTRDTTNHSFVLPDLPVFDQICLECEVWQLTNPGQHRNCPTCWTHATREALPANTNLSSTDRDALPRLDIPQRTQGQGQKRMRSVSCCSTCDGSLLGESKHCSSYVSADVRSTLSPSSPEHRVKRSRAGRNSKLPIAALNRLQAWLDANKHNPYPTAETKRWLAQECGITEKQVNTWFTNARARQMSAHQVDSGSEAEVADDSDDAEPAQASTSTSGYIQDTAQAGPSHRHSAYHSHSRARTSRRGKKKDYRRTHNAEMPQTPLLLSPASMTKSPIDPSVTADQETWQCTFCLKALVPKSWRRHEDTQHRPKTQAARWTCMLHGPRLSFPNRTNTGSVCAFCMVKNPTEEHFLKHHRIDECSKRDATDRTFYRPDHLRQHVKNFHNATLFDIVQARWKTAAETVAEGWTCGFCGERLDTWDKRETHISNHFKEGMTMSSWREYPDMEKQPDKKKAKGKGKEKEKSSAFSGSFMNLFRRPSSHQQLQTQPEAPSNIFTNSFQPIPMTPSTQANVHGYQTADPSCTTTAYTHAYRSPTTPMGLGISQAPVLPDIPNVSPLVLQHHDFDAVGNFTNWAPMPTTTYQQQLQYQYPNTNAYEEPTPAAAAAVMQPDYGSMDALGMHLYGNPIDYHGTWAQQPPSSPQDPNQYPQYHQGRQQ